MQKYGNIKVEIDGEKFDSRHEANRWCELKYLERIGMIHDLRRQVPYELIPAQRIDGKVVERACKYIADFVYYDTCKAKTIVEDAKSPATRTDSYRIKKKLMLERHGIQIVEV